VSIVADISPLTVNKEGGLETMRTIRRKIKLVGADILPRARTLSNIAAYEADLASPGKVRRRPRIIPPDVWDICFDSRDNYINYP
jgi:hypothetical protein